LQNVSDILPDPDKIRIISEHKSVITAHRNRSARHDDLNNLYQDTSNTSELVIVTATVMVGIAERYLNVSDQIKRRYQKNVTTRSGKTKKVLDAERFNDEVLSRLRAHDQNLWKDFSDDVSYNTTRDINATFELFRTLPVRPLNARNKPGYDAFLIVPVHYDNVNPARVARDNPFGIDIERDYQAFIQRIINIYEMLWER